MQYVVLFVPRVAASLSFFPCYSLLFLFLLLIPLFYVPGVLNDLKYADSHEWVKVNGNTASIGITDHAQDHLRDVVYVELLEVGATVKQGETFGVVESVKATSDVNSHVSGKVVEVNKELSNSPTLVSIVGFRSCQ
ncbi:hypothetical protein REPUB_Repub20aG0071400 [Reevesia pubescens]